MERIFGSNRKGVTNLHQILSGKRNGVRWTCTRSELWYQSPRLHHDVKRQTTASSYLVHILGGDVKF